MKTKIIKTALQTRYKIENNENEWKGRGKLSIINNNKSTIVGTPSKFKLNCQVELQVTISNLDHSVCE